MRLPFRAVPTKFVFFRPPSCFRLSSGLGEAIHGAGYVPPTPRSKGCARTFPLHQDELISWLGLADVTEAIWQTATIGLSVTVQGEYRDIDR